MNKKSTPVTSFTPDIDKLVRSAPHVPEFKPFHKEALLEASLSTGNTNTPDYLFVLKAAGKVISPLVCSTKGFLSGIIPTRQIKEQAKHTAYLNTLSNIVDGVFNTPTWYTFLKSLGIAQLPASLVVSFVGLLFANAFFEGASKYRKGSKIWSSGGFLGLIMMNLIQTAISGVGTVLWVNRGQLPEKVAETTYITYTVDNPKKAVSRLNQPLLDEIDRLETYCKEAVRRAEELNESESSNFDNYYNRHFGTHAELHRQWANEPLEIIPICRQPAVLRMRVEENRQKVLTPVRELIENETKYATKLELLKNHNKALYSLKFDEKGRPKAPLDELDASYSLLMESLMEGNIGPVIISLSFITISAGTSFFSIWFTYFLLTSRAFEQASDERKIQIGQSYVNQVRQALNNEISLSRKNVQQDDTTL